MSQAESPELERAHDLLVLRATEGLDADFEREMDALLARFPELDPEHYERAAALTDLALAPPAAEPLPAHLRAAIERSALEHMRPAAPVRRAPLRTSLPSAQAAPPARGGTAWLAWTVAAASLLLSASLWMRRPRIEDPEGIEIAGLPGTVQLEWQAGPSERSGTVRGRVVWNDARDEGYMVFDEFPELAANDASVEQYQLWIFDSGRDDATPVDGGVFDLPAAGGEVRVPIDAKLDVDQAKLFAVTIERPGGVVVSRREHIVALAQL